jgi:nicotinate-nucleotide adenylyltransferase
MARLKIGVLGGTFDPIHIGHLILASCAVSQFQLDRVLFTPAGDPWRKAALHVSPSEHRLAMVRLAIQEDSRFELDESEVRRKGPSYTSQTLLELKARLPEESQLFFLAGSDALDDMRYWRDPQLIFATARLAIAPRLKTPVPGAPVGHPSLGLEVPDYEEIDMPYVGINSTGLRSRVNRGLSIRYMVPESVEAYIKEQGLYR